MRTRPSMRKRMRTAVSAAPSSVIRERWRTACLSGCLHQCQDGFGLLRKDPDPKAWLAIRRRFVRNGVLGTIWLVGFSAIAGLLFGGPIHGLLAAGLLLILAPLALVIAFRKLRRDHDPSRYRPRLR